MFRIQVLALVAALKFPGERAQHSLNPKPEPFEVWLDYVQPKPLTPSKQVVSAELHRAATSGVREYMSKPTLRHSSVFGKPLGQGNPKPKRNPAKLKLL